MGKPKRLSKKKKLIAFVDLREQCLAFPVSKEAQELMVQRAIKMEEKEFKALMEENALICFTSLSFMDLFRVGPPYSSDCFADMWCPSHLKEVGRHFSMEHTVFVDDASDAKYELVFTREKERLKVADELIREEDIQKAKGASISQEENAREKSVLFKEVKGGRSRRMAVPNFIKFIEAHNLICYNYVGYTILYYEEGQASKEANSPYLHLWLPGRDWDDALLQSDVVYVEKLGTQHSLLFQRLEEQEEEEQKQQEGEDGAGVEVKSQEDINEVEEEVAVEEVEIEEVHEEEVAATVGAPAAAAEQWEKIRNNNHKATAKELCTLFDFEVHTLHLKVDRLEHKVDCLEHKVDRLEYKVDRKLVHFGNQMDDLQLSLSRTTERSCRQSFSQFYEKLNPGVAIWPPITNKLLPYFPNLLLEKVAKLCSKSGVIGQHMAPKPVPKFADIDILLRIEGNKFQSPEVGRARTTTASEDSMEREMFDSIVVAEVTRSIALCSSPGLYKRPKKLTNDSSSKLLYKFVQLERDILAAMAYYSISLDRIEGAAIISPSFMRLCEPKKLATKVLGGLGTELASVKTLHDRDRLWLIDI